MVDRLECAVMPYAWGSRSAIAELLGKPSPAPAPEAELWMGAHPLAPSRLARDGAATTLLAAIDGAPERELGRATTSAFGARLPFLLKVLAAETPLSLQAHPTEARAREGFADEDRRGIARDAPTRNYKDASHKPELLCALTPFDALCGFRSRERTLALFDALSVPEVEPILAPLRATPGRTGLAETFRAIMTIPPGDRERIVGAVVAACADHRGPFASECSWAGRIAKLYPGDPGILGALLLNLVHLEPGEAIYLDAGNLHAYLGGVGVEVMASSDNVLRGGLTPKHVDVPELMRVLDFSDGGVTPLRARAIDLDEEAWETPAREFRLSRVHVGSRTVEREVRGPEILLCVEGRAEVAPKEGPSARAEKGVALFVPGSTDRYSVSAQPGERATFYRATVNLP
ncbi:MAG: mannose-6-phosphate isomerase, class I [Deltaproteobacteria bacterium]|nr:mannose-6-phosphate isomerase, class I [Deltaproteobacteria bacterium]